MTGNAEKFEKVDTFGEVPLARFGHTITQVSKSKVILFGGATGDTGKYVITGDIYTLCTMQFKWQKLDGAGIAPSPRAAHGSCAVDSL
jgi:protein phosphatase